MKIKKWQYCCILGWILLIYFMMFMGNRETILSVSDTSFLYNRASSLLQSLKDFNFGIFGYNNFHNLGYGDAFYYGGLTLIPFLVFIPMGMKVFTTAYFIGIIVVHILGVHTLTKRVSGCDNKLFILLYLSNICVTASFFYTALLCSNFAIGLGYFYIAFIIDFFRDKKSFVKASVMFFIIFETHTITAVMLFCITVIVFFMYYDKNRWGEYIKFGCITVLFCLYRICNILYHLDTLILRANVLEETMKRENCFFSTKGVLFGGQIVRLIIRVLTGEIIKGYSFIDLVIFTIVIVCLTRNWSRVSKSGKSLLVISCIGIIISQPVIWAKLNPFIQFPIRYSMYVVLCIYYISLRWLKNSRVTRIIVLANIVSAVALTIMGGKMLPYEETDIKQYIVDYVSAGEYWDFSYKDIDLHKFKEMAKQCIDLKTGHEYNYDFEDEKLIVNVDYSDGNTKLRVPKLWYKGYICYNKETGKKYNCESGSYQFIEIDLGNDTGKFVIKYTHPWWLWGIMFLSYLSVVAICVFYLRNRWLKRPLI